MQSPVGIEARPLISLGFQVQDYPFSVNWAFACKTEALGSLYSQDLLIPNQLMHKQKFKDPLSSTCQISSERIVLGL